MLNKKAGLTSLYHMSMYVKHFEFTESQQCGRSFFRKYFPNVPSQVFVTLNGRTPVKNGVGAKPFTKMGLHNVYSEVNA